MSINDTYKIESKRLGKGSFAEVFLGANIKTGESVAIKCITIAQIKKIEQVVVEIDIMKKMNHPNIVKYQDVIKNDEYWYIVMEYCDAGTLTDVIEYHKTCDNHKIEHNTFYYMSQMKDALQYIRTQGCVHRDLKPMNVLLMKPNLMIQSDGDIFPNDISFQNKPQTDWDKSHNLIIKVADFGLARNQRENDNMLNTICGSPLYMAPELLINEQYNSKVDLWSYGIIMYEMLFGEYPVFASTIQQLKKHIKQKSIDFHLNKNFTPECFDLLTKLLEKDQDARISWENFFDHEWFHIWNNSLEEQFINANIYKKENSEISHKNSNLTKISRSNIPVKQVKSIPVGITEIFPTKVGSIPKRNSYQSSSPYNPYRYSPTHAVSVSPIGSSPTGILYNKGIHIDHNYADQSDDILKNKSLNNSKGSIQKSLSNDTFGSVQLLNNDTFGSVQSQKSVPIKMRETPSLKTKELIPFGETSMAQPLKLVPKGETPSLKTKELVPIPERNKNNNCPPKKPSQEKFHSDVSKQEPIQKSYLQSAISFFGWN